MNLVGVSPQDDAEAVRWYKLAAWNGDVIAQHNLAVKFAKGEMAPQNLVFAYMLFDLSAAQGSDDARRHKEKLVAAMTREEIAEAEELVSEWNETCPQDVGV